MFDKLKKAAQHWDQVSKAPSPSRTRWWQSKYIVRHINRRFAYDESLSNIPSGDIAALRQRFPERRFSNAVSVGCGNATKEIALIRDGLVQQFNCYEISEIRVQQGKAAAQKLGISNQIHFFMEDALRDSSQRYDLVYWNNSLHHMFDVDAAVRWSREVLTPGGVFYMNDFVGPTRMQWTDRMIDIATQVRTALPEKYLSNPKDPQKLLSRSISRPDTEKLAEADPTECADSGRILNSVRKYFDNPEIILTGGVIYHSALNDVLHNLDETEDKHLLDLMLIIDDLCLMLGETHYGVAIAQVK